jgi:hypothetical protein
MSHSLRVLGAATAAGPFLEGVAAEGRKWRDDHNWATAGAGDNEIG